MDSIFSMFVRASVAAPTEEDIRERAYRLWEEAGRPEGDGVEFWVRAEEDLLGGGEQK